MASAASGVAVEALAADDALAANALELERARLRLNDSSYEVVEHFEDPYVIGAALELAT